MATERLAGKTALITGAGKRLGAAMSTALAKQGVRVLIHYNHGEKAAEELAQHLIAAGGKAAVIQGDLSNGDGAKALMDRTFTQFGAIHILINNASIFHEMTFMESTEKAVAENMAVHVIAPLLLGQAFAAQGLSGSIINMIDTRVMDYDFNHVPYHMSKKALHSLTKMMAVEFAPLLRVNAVAPGLILPPAGQDESYLEELKSSNPLNRWGSTDDIVRAILYLLESDFVTGQTLFVDGGRHLRGRMYE